jgi:tetratricopeptide (TPR) repeat protein
MLHRVAAWFLLAALAAPLWAQQGTIQWAVGFTPALAVPLGADSDLYTLGAAGHFTGLRRLVSYPVAYTLSAGLGYGLAPVHAEPPVARTYLNLISLDIGAGFEYALLPWLLAGADLRAGGYVAFLGLGPFQEVASITSMSRWGGNAVVSGGLGLTFLPAKSWRVGVGASYWSYLGLYQGLLAGASAEYILPASRGVKLKERAPRPEPLRRKPAEERTLKSKGEGLELTELRFADVFPVLFKYYDSHPIGAVTLNNREKIPAEGVSVELLVKPYMDNPKECASIQKLAPGESRNIELSALFNTQVLEVFEDEVVSAAVTLYYTAGGRSFKREYTQPLRILSRNALSWDDDRKAAAFVTGKDPEVLSFSKNVAGLATEKTRSALNPNLLKALGIHEALRQYQMRYVPDPSTPYKELSRNRQAQDFLQFPRQTLRYKAGDCDDLSILFSALLESVGVETAFITVPGHIYLALSLDLPPAEAARRFVRPEELILTADRSWLPLEVTEIDGGFLKAWQLGAKQWRENQVKGQARLIPVHEAWTVFEPVGYRGEKPQEASLDMEALHRGYREELARFVERELYPQIARLRGDAQQETPKLLNSLGVLYASYAQYEQAGREFDRALAKGDFVPALINKANLLYLRGDLQHAREFYETAYKKQPASAQALLGMARVQHELENYGEAQRLYDRLKSLDPDTAGRFTYLGLRGEEASRAADAGQLKGVVVWAEE